MAVKSFRLTKARRAELRQYAPYVPSDWEYSAFCDALQDEIADYLIVQVPIVPTRKQTEKAARKFAEFANYIDKNKVEAVFVATRVRISLGPPGTLKKRANEFLARASKGAAGKRTRHDPLLDGYGGLVQKKNNRPEDVSGNEFILQLAYLVEDYGGEATSTGPFLQIVRACFQWSGRIVYDDVVALSKRVHRQLTSRT